MFGIEFGLKSLWEDELTDLNKVEIIKIKVLKVEGIVLAAVREGFIVN